MFTWGVVAPPHALSRMGKDVRYRAAVVSRRPVSYADWDGTASGAQALMMQNVAGVGHWAAKAAARGAQIVVFPEDTISSFGGGGQHWVSRFATPALFAEPLPSAGHQMCSPAFNASPVASALACVAKRLDLVLVVGLGISAPCQHGRQEPLSARPLPCDSRTGLGQFDGAAAFGPSGALLGQHRKAHLSYSWHGNTDVWDEAPIRASVFDTPFGVKFGLMVRPPRSRTGRHPWGITHPGETVQERNATLATLVM